MLKVECRECGNMISHFSTKTEGCKGCELAELRFYFEDRWNNGEGFMKNICEAIVKADLENLAHLYRAFPRLVDGYSVYAFGKTWEQFQNDKRDI